MKSLLQTLFVHTIHPWVFFDLLKCQSLRWIYFEHLMYQVYSKQSNHSVKSKLILKINITLKLTGWLIQIWEDFPESCFIILAESGIVSIRHTRTSKRCTAHDHHEQDTRRREYIYWLCRVFNPSIAILS